MNRQSNEEEASVSKAKTRSKHEATVEKAAAYVKGSHPSLKEPFSFAASVES
jgi:hypothetical protein